MPRPSDSKVSQQISRQRYRSSAAWSPKDDTLLLRARAEGMTWAAISEQYFPSKGDNACRKHHERLMRRRNDENWDNDKLQDFATEYWRRRKDIWAPLAEATGQRWQFVEEKVLELGLARIRAAAMEANKHNRRVSGMEDDLSDGVDSGIAMEDDEAEMEAGRRQPSGTPLSVGGAATAASSSSTRRVPGVPDYNEPPRPIHTSMSPPLSVSPPYSYSPAYSPAYTHPPSFVVPPSQPSLTAQQRSRVLPPPTTSTRKHSIASILSP